MRIFNASDKKKSKKAAVDGLTCPHGETLRAFVSASLQCANDDLTSFSGFMLRVGTCSICSNAQQQVS